jgi:hypothetical protein
MPSAGFTIILISLGSLAHAPDFILLWAGLLVYRPRVSPLPASCAGS